MTNHPNRSKKKLRESQAALQPAIDMLKSVDARCMEQVLEPESGIVCERWLLRNGKSVIAYGTPIWRELFVPCGAGEKWSDTLDGLRAAADLPPMPEPNVAEPAVQSVPA